MQFHLNGFRTGDPEIHPAAPHADVRDEVDVLIVGCGPAGLTLAAQLARFPSIHTRIVERKAGPLELGQADGIALPHDGNVQRLRLCRSCITRSLLGE